MHCKSGNNIPQVDFMQSFIYIRVTLKIKNSIKPYRVQHILRHFYYTTMKQLCKFEALSRPEIQCKCHKDNPSKK